MNDLYGIEGKVACDGCLAEEWVPVVWRDQPQVWTYQTERECPNCGFKRTLAGRKRVAESTDLAEAKRLLVIAYDGEYPTNGWRARVERLVGLDAIRGRPA